MFSIRLAYSPFATSAEKDHIVADTTASTQEALQQWSEREQLAEQMVPLIGSLYRNNNVVTSIYGRSLVHESVVDILKAHRFARQVDEAILPVEDSFAILQAMRSEERRVGKEWRYRRSRLQCRTIY